MKKLAITALVVVSTILIGAIADVAAQRNEAHWPQWRVRCGRAQARAMDRRQAPSAPTAGLYGRSLVKYSFPVREGIRGDPFQRISTRSAKGRPEPFVVILKLNDAKYRASRS